MNNCSQSMNNGLIGVRGGVIPSVYTVKKYNDTILYNYISGNLCTELTHC